MTVKFLIAIVATAAKVGLQHKIAKTDNVKLSDSHIGLFVFSWSGNQMITVLGTRQSVTNDCGTEPPYSIRGGTDVGSRALVSGSVVWRRWTERRLRHWRRPPRASPHRRPLADSPVQPSSPVISVKSSRRRRKLQFFDKHCKFASDEMTRARKFSISICP